MEIRLQSQILTMRDVKSTQRKKSSIPYSSDINYEGCKGNFGTVSEQRLISQILTMRDVKPRTKKLV